MDVVKPRLVTSADLLVDRHYRGAIVMVGAKMFAIDERAIRLVERVQRGQLLRAAGGDLSAEDREALAGLVASGVLREGEGDA